MGRLPPRALISGRADWTPVARYARAGTAQRVPRPAHHEGYEQQDMTSASLEQIARWHAQLREPAALRGKDGPDRLCTSAGALLADRRR
jgi:hypothetical protein